MIEEELNQVENQNLIIYPILSYLIPFHSIFGCVELFNFPHHINIKDKIKFNFTFTDNDIENCIWCFGSNSDIWLMMEE